MSVDYIARRAAQRHTRTFSRSAVVDRLWPVPGTALHSSEAGYGPCRSSAACYRAPRRSAASLWPAMVLSALCGLQRLCRRCIRGGNHRRYCQALAGHGAGGCLRGDRLRGPPPALTHLLPCGSPQVILRFPKILVSPQTRPGSSKKNQKENRAIRKI